MGGWSLFFALLSVASSACAAGFYADDKSGFGFLSLAIVTAIQAGMARHNGD